jgi:hypothetical protein
MRVGPVIAGVVVLALVQAPAAPAHASSTRALTIEVLSSAPDQVSGDDALLRVHLGAGTRAGEVRISRNGHDVTGAFTADPGGRSLTGLVDELALGDNAIRARAGRGPTARATLRNHPIEGPIFSGPKQYPFLCRTEQAELGQPLVDNQDAEGMRVYALDSSGAKTDEVTGWSRDCGAPSRVDYLYRTTGGSFLPLPADGSVPADAAKTTTMDGQTVDFVVRRERGTINRFVYQIAVLDPARSAWGGPGRWVGGRAIYLFAGGVGIGHDQGTLPGSALDPVALGRGYAVMFSTGTRASVHYNLVLGGETALMLKEHFIEEYGVPRYTVGVGASGGAIQQYNYGQNFGTRLLDAAIPQYSYPDMVTQTIHIGDCELLEYYMDVTDGDNPKWRDRENRTALIGLNATATSDECVNGWRGLTPLARTGRRRSTRCGSTWTRPASPTPSTGHTGTT